MMKILNEIAFTEDDIIYMAEEEILPDDNDTIYINEEDIIYDPDDYIDYTPEKKDLDRYPRKGFLFKLLSVFNKK